MRTAFFKMGTMIPIEKLCLRFEQLSPAYCLPVLGKCAKFANRKDE
jgi:hypothetical protein